jgi:hypothetical protein
MIDRDLAEIYGVETKYLKRSVRNNIKRFPSDFMFELTTNEAKNLRCEFCTLGSEKHSKADGNEEIPRCKFCTLAHFRYQPFAFTEYGVGMLSSVLHSESAILVNILIIRAFTELRRDAQAKLDLVPKLESLESLLERRFDRLEARLEKRAPSAHTPAKECAVTLIQECVARHFGLAAIDLKSASRTQTISLARQIAIFFMKKHLGMGFSEIGRNMGGRDHSTILHAYRKIHVDSEDNDFVRQSVLTLQGELQHLLG